jgi:hypothetical protein
MSPISRLLMLGLAGVALSACAMFSQTPTLDVRQMVADAAKPGTPMDTAEAGISATGFSCTDSHGSFIDADGHEHSPPKFVTCTEKPGRFAFTCAYRDYVYLIPRQGIVDEVYVVRGPNCLDK